MTTPELSGELRNLVDARLDQIERALLRVDVSFSELPRDSPAVAVGERAGCRNG